MKPAPPIISGPDGRSALEHYYRLHSRIYDATRWTFLFGRDRIVDEAARIAAPRRILEVGCGTGRNLVRLCRTFPYSSIAGLDLSEAMLAVARRRTAHFGTRVRLLHQRYDAASRLPEAPDLILFSYALSMFNPGYAEAVAAAHGHLSVGGWVAVVDFHDTPFPAFRRWMGLNHVRMDAQMLPPLRERFLVRLDRQTPAYCGVWRYLHFIGQKSAR